MPEALELERRRPIDGGRRGDLVEQRRIPERPVRIADRVNDGVPAGGGQILDELQRALHAASTLGRKAIREDQDLLDGGVLPPCPVEAVIAGRHRPGPLRSSGPRRSHSGLVAQVSYHWPSPPGASACSRPRAS